MILGNGMIATALRQVDREDVLFCASGVSNAQGHIKEACRREETLLREQIGLQPDKIVVYISSYSIHDTDDRLNSPYLQHKKRMEQLVATISPRYLIARTSNVTGISRQAGNLMNFLYHHLTRELPFDIWMHTDRNLIDVDHLAIITGAYLREGPLNRNVFLVGPEDKPIAEVAQLFEQELNLRGHYRLLPEGTYYHCDKTMSLELFEKSGIETKDYVRRLIRKYFTGRTKVRDQDRIRPGEGESPG